LDREEAGVIHFHGRAYFVSAGAWRARPTGDETGIVDVDRGEGEPPSLDGLVTIYTRGVGEAAHIERAQSWRIRGLAWCSTQPKMTLTVTRSTLAEIDAALKHQEAQKERSLPVPEVSARADRILRSSVPDHWKACTSPIGAVQSYIAELEQALIRRGVDLDTLPAEQAEADERRRA
jgi:hypothetical protein